VTAAIIVAAGRGTRMGPGVDKLFLEVAGAPVIAHTWRRFDAAGFDEVLLVVREGMEPAFKELAGTLSLQTPWRLVGGGDERQDSVWQGLSAVRRGTHCVAIHDGARPCTSLALIRRAVASAQVAGASVTAHPAVDTVKESDNGRSISRHLDRTKIWLVQTPQCFQVEIIRRALEEVRRRGLQVTDDTAACEYIGQPVELVASNEPNPKVTCPGDIPWIEYLLRRNPENGQRANGRDDRI